MDLPSVYVDDLEKNEHAEVGHLEVGVELEALAPQVPHRFVKRRDGLRSRVLVNYRFSQLPSANEPRGLVNLGLFC